MGTKRSYINQVWVGDTTYIYTDECWLYLTIVKDLYDKKIVGYFWDNILIQFNFSCAKYGDKQEKTGYWAKYFIVTGAYSMLRQVIVKD